MRQVTLFLMRSGWMMRDTDPEVKRLFGTDTLPTAFTPRADPAVVLSAIQKLNPDAEVRMVGLPS